MKDFQNRHSRGQTMVEFALVLPFLAILLLGVIELGFVFYDYLNLATANREGVRLASRARFTDQMVAARIVSSSGLSEDENGDYVPNMRLTGEGAQLGIIVSHFPLDADGNLINAQVTVVTTGTFFANNLPRAIIPEDTRITDETLDRLLENASTVTENINTYRLDNDFDAATEELVVVESFFAHEMFTSAILPIDQRLVLYFYSTMRVLRDSRLD